MKRYDKIILLLLLLVFGAGSYYTFSGALNPYVSFGYADAVARFVQIKGAPVDGTLVPDESGGFTFRMNDLEGGTAIVYHAGEMPPNLMDADNIVVAGRFDRSGNFNAQRILVQCPTRYQAEQAQR